ncbi:MAG: hypothetical protein PHX18_01970 [Candidatus Gastranaerophilales bacterium]|nr:hypothetical protein [Candidatus Gastranaerophilales bacterium]
MLITPVSIAKNNSFHRQAEHSKISEREFRQQYTYAPAFSGQQKIYSDKINALKLEMQTYPRDIEYRRNLLENAGLNPDLYYRLRSVIGSGEIKDIMADYQQKPEVYSVGENDINIADRTIRANLHMHTVASDGFLTIEELLGKASLYADEAAKIHKDKAPFTIAITDHDTTESAEEAIKLIFANPDKYKNLRVILGAEITSFNNIAAHIKDKPTCTHILLYGIDPGEKDFKNFINHYKSLKQTLSGRMIDDVNAVYKEFFDEGDFYNIKQLREQYTPVRKNIVGIYNYVNDYVVTKMLVKESVLKNPELKQELEYHGIDTTVDGFMKEMQEYFNIYDKNNKLRKPTAAIIEVISMFTVAPQDTIRDMVASVPLSQKAEDCIKQITKNLEKYKITFEPQYHYVPKIQDIYAALQNQPDSLIGLAHPLDYVQRIESDDLKYEVLEEVYKYFKEHARDKAAFAESYYQSYNGALRVLQHKPETKAILDELGKAYGLYQTGSGDTHRINIFKRYY